jgi:hypothetical protein
MPLLLKAFLTWLPMIPLAIANGVVRESILSKRMNQVRAQQVSSVTGAAVMIVYALFLHRALPFASPEQAWTYGFIWLSLTIAFEFAFGRLVVKHSWRELLADYNVLEGKLWPLVLAAITVAPRIAAALDV